MYVHIYKLSHLDQRGRQSLQALLPQPPTLPPGSTLSALEGWGWGVFNSPQNPWEGRRPGPSFGFQSRSSFFQTWEPLTLLVFLSIFYLVYSISCKGLIFVKWNLYYFCKSANNLLNWFLLKSCSLIQYYPIDHLISLIPRGQIVWYQLVRRRGVVQESPLGRNCTRGEGRSERDQIQWVTRRRHNFDRSHSFPFDKQW